MGIIINNVKIQKLSDILKATDTRVEFNIIEDLKSLERSFGLLKSKDYRKKLKALVQKYEETELTSIRKVIIDECEKGNMNAIKLYIEHFKNDNQQETTDTLLPLLKANSNEVFKDV